MSNQPDYFAPTKWEPPPKPPRKPISKVPFIVLGVLLVLGAMAYGALQVRDMLAKRQYETKKSLAITVPASQVVSGKPLKWRTLAHWRKRVSFDNPRPEVVFADFTADRQNDIMLLDFKKASRIFQTDGTAREVKGKWDIVSRFYPWDYDRDGVAELIPHGVVYALIPVAEGCLANVRLGGG